MAHHLNTCHLENPAAAPAFAGLRGGTRSNKAGHQVIVRREGPAAGLSHLVGDVDPLDAGLDHSRVGIKLCAVDSRAVRSAPTNGPTTGNHQNMS